jgi:hypothetical protein
MSNVSTCSKPSTDFQTNRGRVRERTDQSDTKSKWSVSLPYVVKVSRQEIYDENDSVCGDFSKSYSQRTYQNPSIPNSRRGGTLISSDVMTFSSKTNIMACTNVPASMKTTPIKADRMLVVIVVDDPLSFSKDC